MKNAISLLLLFFIYSCDSKDTQRKDPKEEIPQALQDEIKGLNLSSKNYRGANLVTEIYFDLVQNSQQLNEVEDAINLLDESKEDSLDSYNKYNRKSISYYSSAKNIVQGDLTDSVLKEKLLKILEDSEKKYQTKYNVYTSLLKEIENNQINIKDSRTVLQVLITLPIMEKYQKENQPSKNPLIKYKEQQEQVKMKLKKLTP